MRVRLLVAYDGTEFRGLAPQPGIRTVVGVLGEALGRITRAGKDVEFVMSGRTDAGVHAWGQVLSCDLPEGLDLERLHRSLVAMLAPEIVVREIEPADPDFSARFDATSRTYRYRIANTLLPDPFFSKYEWHVPDALDIGATQAACEPLLGEHDFTTFCKRLDGPGGPMSSTRLLMHANWRETLNESRSARVLELDIKANAFAQQMVRAIVGLSVAAGLGRVKVTDIPTMLEAKSRETAPPIAPPQGLTLWHVGYDGERYPPRRPDQVDLDD